MWLSLLNGGVRMNDAGGAGKLKVSSRHWFRIGLGRFNLCDASNRLLNQGGFA